MKQSSDPYNMVGAQVLAECAENNMTYGYACVVKIPRRYLPPEAWISKDPIIVL